MNYLKEIIAFYDRQVQQPLSASAITLWHALMYINNKTRWKKEFTAAGTFVQFIGGLTESSFKRARKELVELGYIEYESLGRGKAPKYKLNSLVAELENPVSEEVLTEEFQQKDPQSVLPTFVNPQKEIQTDEVTPTDRTANQLTDQVNPVFMNMEDDVANLGNQAYLEDPLHITEEIISFKPALKQQEYQALEGFYDQSWSEQSDQVINEPASTYVGRSSTSQPKNDAEEHIANQSMNHTVTEPPNQHPTPLYKQNINKRKNKQNNLKALVAENTHAEFPANQESENKLNKPDAIIFYQKNFGIAGPFVMESLLDWIQDFGDELVIEAMKRALERNKTSWGYVKGILNAWFKKGIRTVEAAEAEKVAFENKRKQHQRRSLDFLGGKEEVIPSWFYGQKRERKERERSTLKQQATREDLARVKREYLKGVKVEKVI